MVAIAFAIAAALGAVARTEFGRRWNRTETGPWGTAMVNISGSFFLGMLHHMTPPMVTIIGVGGLGAFTTFSSFARDAVALVEERRPALSLFYVAVTCFGGIGAAALGMRLA